MADGGRQISPVWRHSAIGKPRLLHVPPPVVAAPLATKQHFFSYIEPEANHHERDNDQPYTHRK
jgi:hypothetical protein